VEFHFYLPQIQLSHDEVVEQSRAAEAVGFEGVGFIDHMVPPLAPDQPMWEAMSIATWTLARTETLRVGHLVLCDGFRHPTVLARQATSLDHASGGRFELGIGWGSRPAELEIFGIASAEPRERVGRLAESLAVMRALWTGESVDFDGEYFQLSGAQQRPTPIRPIPITIGGVGRRTLQLVREYADWWNIAVHHLDRLEELRDRAESSARLSVMEMVAPIAREADRAATEDMVRKQFGSTIFHQNIVIGTTSELRDHYARLETLGVERAYIWFADFDPTSTLERFADVIRS
jgi:alkanesulfonate monooxygenase SsuD/methylene tetrahydromethanopterin reductase-like flavin-dependent oxidoreductase (luciferase family)